MRTGQTRWPGAYNNGIQQFLTHYFPDSFLLQQCVAVDVSFSRTILRPLDMKFTGLCMHGDVPAGLSVQNWATVAPQEPVPEAYETPTPRSQNETSISLSFST